MQKTSTVRSTVALLILITFAASGCATSGGSIPAQMFNSMMDLCGGGGNGGNNSGSSCNSGTSQGPTSKGCWPTKNGTNGPTVNGSVLGAITGVVLLGGTVIGFSLVSQKLGLLKVAKLEDYSKKNKVFLLTDISRGEGEYLRGYANLLGCNSDAAVKRFSVAAHDELKMMDVESLSGDSSGQALNAKLLEVLDKKPEVWLNCDA